MFFTIILNSFANLKYFGLGFTRQFQQYFFYGYAVIGDICRLGCPNVIVATILVDWLGHVSIIGCV